MAVYAISTNRKPIAKEGSIKMKRKVTQEEINRRKFFATHDFKIEQSDDGSHKVIVMEKIREDS